MLDRYQTLHETRDNWYKDLPLLAEYNKNLSGTILRLMAEVHETIEELVNGGSLEKIRRELADVGWFLLAAMKMAEGDLFEEMMEKHCLNMLRYRPRDYQDMNADFNQVRAKTKAEEKPVIQEFYAA